MTGGPRRLIRPDGRPRARHPVHDPPLAARAAGARQRGVRRLGRGRAAAPGARARGARRGARAAPAGSSAGAARWPAPPPRSPGRRAPCRSSARAARAGARARAARACTAAATCCSCRPGDPRPALERWYRRDGADRVRRAARRRVRPRRHALRRADDPRPAHALGVLLLDRRDVVQLAPAARARAGASTTSSSTRSATSRCSTTRRASGRCSSRACPDWRAHARWLRRYGSTLVL